MDSNKPKPACTQVYFDGSCPLCQREIAVYRNLKPDEPIQWVDVSAPNPELPQGLSKQELMRRFHTQTAEGRVLSGAEAFVYIWSRLPGWRVLARIAKLPGMLSVMEWSYQGFLKIRPAVQGIFRKFLS